ncbi:hypothetical protein ACOI7N_08440 [Pseudomonas sp. P2758]|uniref:hypothetical protein n=1 Tax=Pseudomonas sp. P2758 TaxID=3409916 RepID=UPI003B59BB91
MTDPTILAVSLPYFKAMQTTVPSSISADCGVTLNTIVSDRNCVVDPFPGGRLGHTLRLLVNDNEVASVTYQNPGDENTSAYFTVPKDSLREGLNRIYCQVTSGSQNEGESAVLRAFFHRVGPAEDPDTQPGDGVNSKIHFEVEDAAKHGVGPELAKRGVLFYVFYPRLRPFDIISFFLGNHVFKYEVSEQDAAQVRPDNPLEIRLSEADFIAAGDGVIGCSCGPRDWIGNTASPEPYSREISLFVNLRGAWLDAPVISPLTATGDVDLGQLQGRPVTSKTHARSPQWTSGDTQKTVCTYTDAAGEDVVLVVDQVINQVPDFPQENLSNSYFAGAKDRQVSIYYKQLRNGIELARSLASIVGVVGDFQPVEDFEGLPEIKLSGVGDSFLSKMFKVTVVALPYDTSYLHLFAAEGHSHVRGKQLYSYIGYNGEKYLIYDLELLQGAASRVEFWMRLGNITDLAQHMYVYFIGSAGGVLHSIRYDVSTSDYDREVKFDSGLLSGIHSVRILTNGQFVVDHFVRS